MIFKDFPDINFIEETQAQFDGRIIEVKKLWQELDKELPKEIIFDLLFTAKERQRQVDQALEEIPKLIQVIDIYYQTPEQEFEERMKKWAKSGIK